MLPRMMRLRHGAVRFTALALLVAGCSAPEGGKTATVLATLDGTPLGIAADATGVYVAVTADAQGSAPQGRIAKLTPGATTATDVVTGLVDPVRVVLEGDAVLWTELGSTGTDGAVARAPKIGGAKVALATALSTPRDVVASPKYVFFVAADGAIGRVARTATGAAKPTAVVAAGGAPTALAVSGTDLWWTDGAAGTVSHVLQQGGDPAVVATGQPGARGLALTKTHAYFSVASGAVAEGPSVRRVKLEGGTVETIAANQDVAGVGRVVLDEAYAYWLTSSGGSTSVVRVAQTGVTTEVVATADSSVLDGGAGLPVTAFDLAVDATAVYWTVSDGVQGAVLTVPR